MPQLLLLSQISKRFFAVEALKDVSFDLEPAEIHAIVGENGAGKSTLIKILAGALKADTGEIHLEGTPVRFAGPRDAIEAGIAVIYQESKLVPSMTVAENIWLHDLKPGRVFGFFPTVNRKRLEAMTREVVGRLGVPISPRSRVRDLSVAGRQLVEIAKALSLNARILVMDEPTASLEAGEIRTLFDLMRSLRDRGTSIVFISHKVEEVLEVADRVTVLRDGEKVAVQAVSSLDSARLIRLIVGRELKEIYPKREVDLGDEVLGADSVSLKRYRKPISFFVRLGEILGITGLLGSGCTELLRSLVGLEPITGRLRLKGSAIKITSPSQAVRHGIGIVPEDRNDGLVMGLSVEDNIALANLKAVTRGPFISQKLKRKLVLPLIEALNIKAPSPRTMVRNLSGGNQQKVAMARWFASHADLLLLDEPTHGVDVGAKAEIHRLMGDFVARGGSILFSSSELPEILGISDRVMVMSRGEITGRFQAGEATQEEIMARASGVEQYQPADKAQEPRS